MNKWNNMSYRLLLMLCLFGIFSNSCSQGPAANEQDDSKEMTAPNPEEEESSSDGELKIEVNGEEVTVQGLENAINSLQEKLSEAIDETADGGGEVVDFRTLKAKLPNKINRMKRIHAEGEKTGAFGIKVSKANATYEDDNRKLEVEILDTGGMGFAKIGLAAYAQIEIDKESDYGFERTYTEDEVKYHVKYDQRNQEGFFKAFVDERFFVNIEGWGIDAADLEKAMRSIGPKSLIKL